MGVSVFGSVIEMVVLKGHVIKVVSAFIDPIGIIVTVSILGRTRTVLVAIAASVGATLVGIGGANSGVTIVLYSFSLRRVRKGTVRAGDVIIRV